MIDLAESARQSRLHLRVWRPIVKGLAAVLLYLFGPIRIRGSYRIPKKGGLLILSNHLSDIDPVVVQVACPRPIHFMAKSELFEMPLLGRILRSLGNFPVKRGAPDRAPLKLSAQLLREGEVVGIFPEGEISEHGDLLDLKTGIALIVRLAPGIPVICCGIGNTQRVIPYGKLMPRPAFHRIDVLWGETRTFTEDATSDEIIDWASDQLRSLISP